ncbi:MAG TPA: DUF930 domain-containing protein [Afifellaceae bacterium]|nr:DUF930 domain-containing protein [Afifellaceae bacterium]
MDQIHAWRDKLRPERLIAYAMAETKTSGHTMQADGGAFRSGGQWYNLRFRCGVTPDHEQVVSFEFRVGDPIPRGEWEKRKLPAVH